MSSSTGADRIQLASTFDIQPDMNLLFGISFGIEDESLAENQIVPCRVNLADNTFFNE